MSIRRSVGRLGHLGSIHALFLAVAGLSGITLLIDVSMVGTLIATLVVSVGLGAAVIHLVHPSHQRTALSLVGLALAIRIAAAFGVYYGSLAIGKGGYIGVDDGVYATAASMLVDYVRGQPISPANVPPYWAGHGYLMGPYVYLEALVFFVFGPNPLPVLVLNAAAMCGVALFAADVSRHLFGLRAGLLTAALIFFTPSLVAWSALNLKDSITLLLVTALLWTLFRFQQRPRWWVLAIAFMIALPIEGLRRWAFYLIVVIIPLAVFVTPKLRPVLRAARWAGAAAVVSVLLLSTLGGSLPLHQINVGVMENIRSAMAKGARTGYAYVPPEGVLARPGDTFVIVGPPEPAPLPGAQPTPTSRTIVVAPGTRIVLGPAAPGPTALPPGSPPGPPTVFVRPGDVIIVSSPAGTAGTPQDPRPLALSWDPETNQMSATLSGNDAFRRLVAYLPTGIVYALFAPFPWQLGRLADAATIPDMLLWYAVLAAGAVSLWRNRAQWRELTAIVVFAAATLAVFAVFEGNTGTLFRHRAMTIPFVILVASPVLASSGWLVWQTIVRRRVTLSRRLTGARQNAISDRANG